MKMSKKWFRSIVVVLLLSALMASIGVGSSAFVTPKWEADTTEFMYDEEIAAAWGDSALFESDDFAGVYINKGRQVVFVYVDGSKGYKDAVSRCKSMGGMLVSDDGNLRQPMLVHGATYSYKQLNEAQQIFVAKGYLNSEICSFSVDYENNCITVGLLDLSKCNKIQKQLVALVEETVVGVDSVKEIVSFEKDEDPITYCTSANGYSQLNATVSGGTGYFSGAVRYTSSTYGDGFITTGHGPAVNAIVYVGSQRIGVVKAKYHNGTNDTAFVKLDSGNTFVPTDTAAEETDSSVPAVGSTIYVRGYNTNPKVLTTVLSNTYSYNNAQDGITWSDMIRVDVGVPGGSSGGGALGRLLDLGRTRTVIGVISATSSTSTVIIKRAKFSY
ncbi:MAG: S1 family peptidase [Oscillospiraceae bacterium]|jgi:hypothetical protein|nr:S1 family peptidase [Oscillospiraceae bacterium]